MFFSWVSKVQQIVIIQGRLIVQFSSLRHKLVTHYKNKGPNLVPTSNFFMIQGNPDHLERSTDLSNYLIK